MMTVIRIQERTPANGHNAIVSFDASVEFPITIQDPFTPDPTQEADLEWYFEEYLNFPFIEGVRARNAAVSIQCYGEALFTQTFANPQALELYKQATKKGLPTLQIEIAGSSTFHRLHWETLYDPHLQRALSQHIPFIRQNIDVQRLPTEVKPSKTINVLLVVARPRGTRDVGYRTISRPLLDVLQKSQQPIDVTLLRPGTYKALKDHLEQINRDKGPGHYHVIHFDVHGGLLPYTAFQNTLLSDNNYRYQARYGRRDIVPYEGEKAFLSLEGEGEKQVDLVEASEIADLLLLHNVPLVILNACQSGKEAGGSEGSLGDHLIRAGVQSVLAMGYSVMVTAAELLMPVLYQELLSDHPLASALCVGRQALANQKARRAYYDYRIDLDDWILPIVYQNQPVKFALQPMTPQEATAFYQNEADRYRPLHEPSYGFVGRDVDILQIEKRLLTKRNLLLIRGMGGAGKTTLLHHLASWWQRTGLVQHIFYFGYDEKSYTRQQIMRTIAQKLLGREDFALFQSRSPESQQAQLIQLLKATRHLLILDNLESITGTQKAILHTLSKKEQTLFHEFLERLVGGETLVLLGSRSTEDWLKKGTFEENRHDLSGLDPEAASLLAERILERHQVQHYRKDKTLADLINLLDGFPLAMEVILSNLTHQSPAKILEALQSGDISLQTGDSEERTENILRCIDYSHNNLSLESQQLLLSLAPFTSVIFRNLLDQYSKKLKVQPELAHLPFERLREVVREAEKWGLLSSDPKFSIFLHIQPVLPYFLRQRFESKEQQQQRTAIERAFREYYQDYCRSINSYINSKEAEEQYIGLLLAQFEYENILTSVRFALRKKVSVIDMYFVLYRYLERQQEHQRGQELDTLVLASLEKLSQKELTDSLEKELVQVLGQAANRQQSLKQYDIASGLYQRQLQLLQANSIEIRQRKMWQSDTYHNLGVIAQKQRKWEEAKNYYQQALQIYVEYQDRYKQASTLHHLGAVAQEQRKWEEAEDYYQQALQIKIEYQARYEQAGTLHNLGAVAQEQRKWEEAKNYYQQVLQIFMEYQARYEQADTLHNLGLLAQEQRKWEEAKNYYEQALQIKIEYQAHYEQASILHNLGIVAEEQQQWEEAKNYYEQALQIKIEYQARYEQAGTLHHLGIVTEEQQQWEEAKNYYEQALQIYVEYQARYEQADTLHNLGLLAQEQRKWEEAKNYYERALQIYIEYQARYEQAGTLHQLGRVAQEQQQWEQAKELFLQSLIIFIDENDNRSTSIAIRSLARLWQASKDGSIPEQVAPSLKITLEEARDFLQKTLDNGEK